MNLRGWIERNAADLVLVAIGVILCALLSWSLWGCIADPRIHQLEQTIAGVRADVDVGGGSDSVTSWIYALGAAVVYPGLRVMTGTWRPLRPK